VADWTYKGAHSELIACAWLLEQGYDVFRNISPYGMMDIIAIKGDEVLKIDVKSRSIGSRKKGHLTTQQRAAGVVPLYVYPDGRCSFNVICGAHGGHGGGISKTGLRGVYWRASRGKFVAELKVGGRSGRKLNLGYFDRLEDACAAREAAEHKYWRHGHAREGRRRVVRLDGAW
jgi:hypothetical protein